MGQVGASKGGVLRYIGLAAVGFAWLIAVGFGWNLAMKYETTPGRAAERVAVASTSKTTPFTCVIFAHPQCPCTRATLVAMRAVEEAHPGRIACQIFIAGSGDGENLTLAKSIPGATVETTSAHSVRTRFDAQTSGQTLVFDRQGKLVFSGGITPGRGVDDPRFALKIFEEILDGRPPKSSPVYGCALGD